MSLIPFDHNRAINHNDQVTTITGRIVEDLHYHQNSKTAIKYTGTVNGDVCQFMEEELFMSDYGVPKAINIFFSIVLKNNVTDTSFVTLGDAIDKIESYSNDGIEISGIIEITILSNGDFEVEKIHKF